MIKRTNYIIILIFLTLIGIIKFLMKDYPRGGISQGFGPAFYPSMLLAILVVLLVVLGIQTLFNKGVNDEKIDLAEAKQLKDPGLILICMILYALLLPYLGFVITGILYLFVTMSILKADMKRSAVVSAVVVIVVYLLFRYAFKVPLPTGVILGG